jgi:phage tail sheath protein FI
MPEYLSPGVYVEEISRGPKPIAGVSTSTAGFVGTTSRGPLRPILVTSTAEFRRRFGGSAGVQSILPDAVEAFFANGGRRLFIARVVGATAAYAEAACGASFTLRAAAPGSWGSRLFVRIEDSTGQTMTPTGLAPVGFRVRAAVYEQEPAGDPLGWFTGAAAAPVPAYAEDFDDLVTDEKSPGHWRRMLAAATLVTLVRSSTAPADAWPARGLYRLGGGADGAVSPTLADYEGEPGGARDEPQGLAALALDACRDVSLVYAPAVSIDIVRAVIRHCEGRRFRFAIVDAAPGALEPGFDPRVEIAGSAYAAFYYPWLRVATAGGTSRLVPPGAAVAGIYARVDLERGVHEAPANEVVRGAEALAIGVDQRTGETLNEHHVNIIREFPGRGIRVWGSRTLSSDGVWKYVNVRRLCIFIERSIDEGTPWVVFERNDERLWARVQDTIRLFLRNCWRSGALQGRAEDEAFFVRCDRTTMTADDILNGRLVCEVGIAAVRPAEFIVLRFAWKTDPG